MTGVNLMQQNINMSSISVSSSKEIINVSLWAVFLDENLA